ncbi:MAG: DUF2769 domain-containing protein [Anaerolineae bacterium]|nr:DUF2769 domain-containing protein [Anaerolineae bacterium]
MPAIPFNMDNVVKCRCGTCPVHSASQCIMQRAAGMPMPPPSLPDPTKFEGVYCSQAVGKSTCTDLDGNLACVCPTCAVWQENGLQTNYFCMRGAAS